MIEGSGSRSGYVPLTNGYVSRRLKNIRIQIQIRNTGWKINKHSPLYSILFYSIIFHILFYSILFYSVTVAVPVGAVMTAKVVSQHLRELFLVVDVGAG